MARWTTGDLVTAADFNSGFGMETTSTVINAALTTTANTTYLTLNFADPGGQVSVMVHGWAKVQSTSGTGNAALMTVNVDGDRPGEETAVSFYAAGEPSGVGISHGRTWTPSGAFTVTLELWGTDTNVQHLASGVTAMVVAA